MSSLAIMNQLGQFPREFERKSWEYLDKRYYMILLLSWLTVYTIVTVLGNLSYNPNAHDAKAREDYLDMIRNSIPAEIIEPIESNSGIAEDLLSDNATDQSTNQSEVLETSPIAEGQGASAIDKINMRREQQALRLSARQQMVSEVGQAGIIGLLNSGSTGGSGNAVLNAFGNGGGTAGNLDEVISAVSGLATAGESKTNPARVGTGSGRVTGSANVTDLLSGMGASGSTSIGRKGSISIALESARVSGKAQSAAFRSHEEISSVINLHNAAIEYCFKRETKLNPNLRGEILVQLVIDFTGKVKSVRILESSFQNSELESCITSRIRSWRFKPISRHQGDVTVRQKYIFN